jgi:hypothetical protein
VNNRGKYADGFYNSMIDDNDSHRPSPLTMFICTASPHALLELQNSTGVNPKASKLQINAHKPDCSNFFNYKIGGGNHAFCCAAMGRKLFSLPGIGDMYTFLINRWNTQPESYQQRVYKNTHATVKRQIQQAENPNPAMFITMEAAHGDNAIHLNYLTIKVALEEPEIGSTDPNIQINNNCMYDTLHFGMPGGSRECEA